MPLLSLLQIGTQVLLTGIFSYIKLAIALLLRHEGRKALLWCGAVTQVGSFFGAVITFILINIVKVFNARLKPCTWCCCYFLWMLIVLSRAGTINTLQCLWDVINCYFPLPSIGTSGTQVLTCTFEYTCALYRVSMHSCLNLVMHTAFNIYICINLIYSRTFVRSHGQVYPHKRPVLSSRLIGQSYMTCLKHVTATPTFGQCLCLSRNLATIAKFTRSSKLAAVHNCLFIDIYSWCCCSYRKQIRD